MFKTMHFRRQQGIVEGVNAISIGLMQKIL